MLKELICIELICTCTAYTTAKISSEISGSDSFLLTANFNYENDKIRVMKCFSKIRYTRS